MSDKQLPTDIESIVAKAKLGLALSLKEMAVATGYSYGMVREWKRAGLPLCDGRITLAEAMAWRRKHRIKKAASPGSPAPSNLPARAARRPNEPWSANGSPYALRPNAPPPRGRGSYRSSRPNEGGGL